MIGFIVHDQQNMLETYNSFVLRPTHDCPLHMGSAREKEMRLECEFQRIKGLALHLFCVRHLSNHVAIANQDLLFL